MVLRERIELSTSPLPRECSTTELPQLPNAADFCHINRASASWVRRVFKSQVFRHCTATMIVISMKPNSCDEINGMNRKDTASGQTGSSAERKKRLAEELRANLQKRKAQARSRRTGEADNRPEGIAIAAPQPKTER